MSYLFVFSIIYAPSEDTFNYALKSGVDLAFAGRFLRFELDVPVDSFRYGTRILQLE